MYEYYTKIEKVVDGDTVDVFLDLGFSVWHKERIRLAGIDTAEKNTPFGKATKLFLSQALDGKMVRLQVSKPDKYGRYLGTLFMNPGSTESINQQLINQKIAKPYDGASKTGLWTEEELNKGMIDGSLS